MKKTPKWHDSMVTIWVTPETRDALKAMRDPKKRVHTIDNVIEDLIAKGKK